MRKVIFIFLAFLAVSCAPQKKLARLIKKHPELVRDSSYVDLDTFIVNIPSVHSDSVVYINTIRHDTFVMEKERLRIRTFIYKDSLFIEGECDEIHDTIIQKETITFPVVVNETTTDWKTSALIGLACIIAGLLLARYLPDRNTDDEK